MIKEGKERRRGERETDRQTDRDRMRERVGQRERKRERMREREGEKGVIRKASKGLQALNSQSRSSLISLV